MLKMRNQTIVKVTWLAQITLNQSPAMDLT